MSKHRRLLVERFESRQVCAVSGLDPGFGVGGQVVDPFFEADGEGRVVRDFAILDDGKILAAGDATIDRYLPDGTPDATFGYKGRAGANFFIQGLDVQADGSFVVAGGEEWYPRDFQIARYLANGKPDLTFGRAGTVVVDMGEFEESAFDVKFDSAGRIVVAGYSGDAMALLRLKSDGSLDKTFGNNGRVFKTFRDSSIAHSIELLSNGQILVAGVAGEIPGSAPMYYDPVVARFNVNGSLDLNFGTSGMTRIRFSSNNAIEEKIADMALQPDGRIVVSTISAPSTLSVARLTSSGALDTSFSGDGLQSIPGYASTFANVALQADGQIVLQAGRQLARLKSNGDLDTSLVYTALASSEQTAVAVDGQGKILIGGAFSNQFGVRRVNTDGSSDVDFALDGLVASYAGSSDDEAFASAVGPDGRIVVVGASLSQFAFARYMPDGTPDTSFSGDGHRLVSPAPGNYFAKLSEVVIQPDGKIVAAGSVSTNVDDIIVIRLNVDGSLDKTFSDDGMVITTIYIGGDDQATGLLLQPDGKIVVSVATYWGVSSASLIRYNSDGSLDTSFAGDGISTMSTQGAFISDIGLMPDGRILAVGLLAWGRETLLMTRFNANGSLDGTFGDHAKIIGSNSSVVGTVDLEMLPDGRFYVLGAGYAVERFWADGTRDTTFEMKPQAFYREAAFRPSAANFQSKAMTTLSDGRLVLAGVLDRQAVVRVLRLDGTPDESFAGDGDWIRSIDLQAEFNQIHRLSGDRLLATGMGQFNPNVWWEDDFLLAQFSIVTPPLVTTTVTKNANGQIVIADQWSHDDQWRFARTETEIIVTDLSSDRRVSFTVNGLPEVAGNNTKQIRIPLALLDSSRKSLVVSGGGGDDQFTFSDSFNAPTFGIIVRGEGGNDAIDLNAYTTEIAWYLSSSNSGSARPAARLPINFTDIEKLYGGRKADTFRLTYQGSTRPLSVDGGDGRDSIQLSADQDMRIAQHLPLFDNYLVVGVVNPQEYAIRSIEAASLTLGASDNLVDLRGPDIEWMIRAGAGNDLVQMYGSATVFAEDGDDIVVTGSRDSIVRGGAGNDIIVGSTANDRLYGEAGRDILVGYSGQDMLVGGDGDDILIGGSCWHFNYPSNDSVRSDMLNVWTSSSSYQERLLVLNFIGVGHQTRRRLELRYDSVSEDQAVDTFYGGLGQDWFFADLATEQNVPSAGLRDVESNESLNDVY